ncbi:MAG: TetR/AcrR family transcriptional regulator [Acidimicrobiales bacterium]|jgi:AcrR family transcriptional regulator
MSDEDKESRRNDILAAAKKVFARSGYHATTIADIARVAKLSYGSIYWYFDSKDDLFHTLMESEAHALREHVTEALATTPRKGGPDARLHAAVHATFQFFDSDRAVVKLLFRDSYALGDRFEKHLFGVYEGFVDDIEKIIEDAERHKLVVDMSPRMVAFAVVTLVGQIAHRRLVTDDGLPTAVVADFVVSLLLNGLLPR